MALLLQALRTLGRSATLSGGTCEVLTLGALCRKRQLTACRCGFICRTRACCINDLEDPRRRGGD